MRFGAGECKKLIHSTDFLTREAGYAGLREQILDLPADCDPEEHLGEDTFRYYLEWEEIGGFIFNFEKETAIHPEDAHRLVLEALNSRDLKHALPRVKQQLDAFFAGIYDVVDNDVWRKIVEILKESLPVVVAISVITALMTNITLAHAQQNVDTVYNPDQTPKGFIDNLRSDMLMTLMDVETPAHKVAAYKDVRFRYSKYKSENDLGADEVKGFDSAVEYLNMRIEAIKEAGAVNSELEWLDYQHDAYMLHIIEYCPEILDGLEFQIKQAMKVEAGPKFSLQKKAVLYETIVRIIEARIANAKKVLQGRNSLALRLESNPQVRQQKLKTIAKAEEDMLWFEKFLGKFRFYAAEIGDAYDAYERFEDDRVEVENGLLKKIKSRNVKVPKNFPYVMFVNKGVDKQYAVLYEYDRVNESLDLKTCNLVSTGDKEKYRHETGQDQTTPSKTFYIDGVYGMWHPVLDKVMEKPNIDPYNLGEAMGGLHVNIDGKPYKAFPLNARGIRWGAYWAHPTFEEGELGQTASHGCIRMPRLLNLTLVELYMMYMRPEQRKGFMKDHKGAYRPGYKMPVVVEDI